MKMNTAIILAILSSLLIAVVGCGSGGGSNDDLDAAGSDTGSDTGTGTGEDTDTGTGTDGDTDSDTDGDTDGDTDSDTDGDTDSDTDGDTDGDTDSDTDGDTDTTVDGGTDEDAGTDTDTDTGAKAQFAILVAAGVGQVASLNHKGWIAVGSVSPSGAATGTTYKAQFGVTSVLE